jgi:hypothetical protein
MNALVERGTSIRHCKRDEKSKRIQEIQTAFDRTVIHFTLDILKVYAVAEAV